LYRKKNTYELKEIPGVHASNPTRSGLQLLVAALKLPQEKLEYYANVKDQETKLIQVIDEIANIQKNLIQYVFPSDETTTGNL
jgi:hypothetical protein